MFLSCLLSINAFLDMNFWPFKKWYIKYFRLHFNTSQLQYAFLWLPYILTEEYRWVPTAQVIHVALFVSAVGPMNASCIQCSWQYYENPNNLLLRWNLWQCHSWLQKSTQSVSALLYYSWDSPLDSCHVHVIIFYSKQK